jgi:hypothetical protein
MAHCLARRINELAAHAFEVSYDIALRVAGVVRDVTAPRTREDLDLI